MSDYPEHDRMMAVKDQSETIGQFLDWLAEQGIKLAVWEHSKECEAVSGPWVGATKDWPDQARGGPKWRCEGGRMVGHPMSNKPGVVGGQCEKCGGTGRVERIEPRLIPSSKGTELLLAEYFGITLARIESEKRAMLARLREMNP